MLIHSASPGLPWSAHKNVSAHRLSISCSRKLTRKLFSTRHAWSPQVISGLSRVVQRRSQRSGSLFGIRTPRGARDRIAIRTYDTGTGSGLKISASRMVCTGLPEEQLELPARPVSSFATCSPFLNPPPILRRPRTGKISSACVETPLESIPSLLALGH